MIARTGTSSMSGFLNVCKPYGWTSHDVVQLVRKLSGTRRVGHSGTLDPAATGVLVVAVGKATRLVDYLGDQDKSYCGDIVLGAATNTDDAEGSVLYARDPSGILLSDVSASLSGFLGEIEQLPPQFSAVKLAGQKAYEIARRGGEAKLTPRRVTIKGLAVVDWKPPTLSVVVHCSKGTYIRSLARDLGERLGVGAHLGALVRLTNGPFDCGDAVGVEELRFAAEFGYLGDMLWPPDLAVAHRPALIVSEQHAMDMLGGRRWRASSPTFEGPLRVYSEDGSFLGLAELQEGAWQPKLVLT
ncbi:MAG TPA: tRNA pseudouridine(55) synthase TruB [Chloroflexota bacterium]|nr:tRNA pseudouridine(55) synthase TruB [Chloroflexota bacterium]